MLRKKPSVFHVVMFGITVGVALIITGYFATYFQQHKSLEASKKGTFPKMPEIGDAKQYASDREGIYYYSANHTAKKTSPENVTMWSKMVYSRDGRDAYINKRKLNGLFTEGLEQLNQRNILYEFKCNKDKVEYAVIEIFEVGKDGKTLDYGNNGKDRDWGYIPTGSPLEQLALIVCTLK